MFRKVVACLLCWQLAGLSAVAQSAVIPGLVGPSVALPEIPADALPGQRSVAYGLVSFENPTGNSLVVHQSNEGTGAARAIIDWESFNIGVNASTHFNQQGHGDWTILNRIHDQSPSQILGRMTADGRILLINQNGIVFGPDAQVNVHSLTASALNLGDADFLDNLREFHRENYQQLAVPSATAQVVNEGVIAAANGGRVFLLGGGAVNSGVIDAPAGQIGLAAGERINLREAEAGDTRRIPLGRYVDVLENPGEAVNAEGGTLLADLGLVGLYGDTVRQDGVIQATTSPVKSSQIELLAETGVRLGAGSWTATPVSASEEKYVGESQAAKILIKGLTTGNPGADNLATVRRIEHYGTIDAPGGEVSLLAGERVFLGAGSRIDVSGLTVGQAADANLVDVQLNSVEMRDAYGQKHGVLKGERVVFSRNAGSAIGHVGGAVDARELTAAEQNLAGGTIDIQAGVAAPGAETADIVVREGAELDFSGGGIVYGAGAYNTTKLLAGNRIYDISQAPEWLRYDKVLGHERVVHRRFGVVEEFNGLYYGGATPLSDYSLEHVEGADAGTLNLVAPRIVLEGLFDGTAQAGPYQIFGENPEGLAGLRRPRGGTLNLGLLPPASASPSEKEAILESATIAATGTELPEDFSAADELTAPANRFAVGDLNAAGLSSLAVNVNTALVVEADARLELQPGGAFSATTRNYLQEGEITARAGRVEVKLIDNLTTVASLPQGGANDRFVDLDGRLYLGESARIDVSGQRIDNRGLQAGEPEQAGLYRGGSIALLDESTQDNAAILRPGSRIDVSGGYVIARNGTLQGGDAGSLALRSESVVVQGEMNGLAVAGRSGGGLLLHADRVDVGGPQPESAAPLSAADPLPESLAGRLTFDPAVITDGGFTRLELLSANDLAIREGATLAASDRRLQPQDIADISPTGLAPVRIEAGRHYDTDGELLARSWGDSAIHLAAGEPYPNLVPPRDANQNARVSVEAGATLASGPLGSIALEGPSLEVSGSLQSRGGTIELTASQGELLVGTEALLSTAGFTQAELPGTTGLPAQLRAYDGGEIVLRARNGNLGIAEGALLDVSGSAPGQHWLRGLDGRPMAQTVAGAPGRIELRALGELAPDGTLLARGYLDGLPGGEFALRSDASNRGLPVGQELIDRLMAGNFDWVELHGAGGLDFDSVTASLGRYLQLDTPRLATGSDAEVSLQAPWLRLTNEFSPSAEAPVAGGGRLTLQGGWIDLVGDLKVSGFGETALTSATDLRVGDFDYAVSSVTSDSRWAGGLTTPGDLTLTANRIYSQVPVDYAQRFASLYDESLSPVFAADFAFDSGGRITTLPGGGDSAAPLLTAGGSLTLRAVEGIDHRGTLVAPLGRLTLAATGPEGRVFLAPGSRLLTSTGDSVPYGTVNNAAWFTTDKGSLGGRLRTEVEQAPEKAVTITGSQVVAAAGSVIDVSGGGEVFGYQFQPSVQGSTNPFTGKLVIVPADGISAPGRVIHLSGGHGLPAGDYAVLSTEHAFRPDAWVLTALDAPFLPGDMQLTEEGYGVVGGYEGFAGTKIGSEQLTAYAVRRADEVFNDGFFQVASLAAVDAGNIAIQAPTTVVNGTFRANPAAGGGGGTVALSGENVFVKASGTPLPEGFAFETALADELFGTLNIDGAAISGQGFEELRIGDLQTTRSLTLEEGSRLQAERVVLSGREAILLQAGAQVEALSGRGEGVAELRSPDGRVVLEEGAVVHASDGLVLANSDLDLRGDFRIDKSFLTLEGKRITFVNEGDGGAQPGMVITPSFWRIFQGIENIGLHSDSDLIFRGNFDLGIDEVEYAALLAADPAAKVAVTRSIAIDAGRIAGETDQSQVTLTADRISLGNSGQTSADDSLAATGTLDLRASELVLGAGEVRIDGFGQVGAAAAAKLDPQRQSLDVVVEGQGSLTTDGNLSIVSRQIAVRGLRDAEDRYHAADYWIDAGSHAVAIVGDGVATLSPDDPGGRFRIDAGTIRQSGVIENLAGEMILSARDDLTLETGGQLISIGNDLFSAGSVELDSESGAVTLAAGSLIDVSAGAQGDAGSITLAGPVGGVAINGELRGGTDEGRGGSFDLDAPGVGDLTNLNDKLAAGGFDERIAVRARGGDLTLAAGETLKARDVYLAADAGALAVAGAIDASGPEKGGTVALHAGQDLLLAAGSVIDASGGGQGGSISLASRDGFVRTAAGSLLDVSGGGGGEVRFRAERDSVPGGVRVDLQGTLRGAGEVIVAGVRRYQDAQLGAAEKSRYLADVSVWMASSAAHEGELLQNLTAEGWLPEQLHLRPEIELDAPGDLTLGAWDLKNARFGGEAGILTVWTPGNLTIAGSLTDKPTPYLFLKGATAKPSWEFNLVAGGDAGAADARQTVQSQGQFKLNDNLQLYSESGDVRLAAGGDLVIGRVASSGGPMVSPQIPLNVGSYRGDVELNAGRELKIDRGVVQTALGDIRVTSGGNLTLGSGSAIRTLGDPTAGSRDYWSYAGGGDIRVTSGGAISSILNPSAWDFAHGTRPPKVWGASYNGVNTTQGIATLAGGSIDLASGGSFHAQVGAFGAGDLTVRTGGDQTGRILHRSGSSDLQALGNFGRSDDPQHDSPQVLELFDSRLQLAAAGDVAIDAIVNPTIAREDFNPKIASSTWNLGYTPDTRVIIDSLMGDISLSGNSSYYNDSLVNAAREAILPPTVELTAGRDIRLSNNFAMVPAAAGNLSLVAGRDIDGGYVNSSGQQLFSRIVMDDSDPALIYGQGGLVPEGLSSMDPQIRSSLLHRDDPEPVTVRAGGDIVNLGLRLPKRAEIEADGDIRFIQYVGQNLPHAAGPKDISIIRAEGDIEVESGLLDLNDFGIEQGGPGSLVVQAGGSIDLGTSNGIRSYGSEKNTALGVDGSDLVVVSGYAFQLDETQLHDVFARLADYGEQYSLALAAGETEEAQRLINEARSEVIAPLLEGHRSGVGNLDMVESLIRTAGGADDIMILLAGTANVGRSALGDTAVSDTGIATTSGGAISIYSLGDLNVNESRVMTFGGGNILAWADQGDINAGRGSRTAISRPPLMVVEDPDTGELQTRFSPPAVGSGIRALTYDPDGASGPLVAPPPGDIGLFAPQGVIDAGEAGIAGGRVILGATEVLNAQNISFSFGSVGVPASSDAGGALGALAGVASLNEVGSIAEEASMAAARQQQAALSSQESFISHWLVVEVVRFLE